MPRFLTLFMCALFILLPGCRRDRYENPPTHFGDLTLVEYPPKLDPAQLLNEQQFDVLQTRLDGFQTENARNRYCRTHFSLSLDALNDVSLQPQAEAWLAAHPQSYAAQVVLGKIMITRAWNARGSAWGKNVSPENRASFHENLVKAQALLEAAAQQHPERPEAFADLIVAGMGLSLPVPELRQYFDEAKQADPSFYPAYSNFFNCVRHRWLGDDDQVAAFVREVVAQAPEHSRVPLLICDLHIELSETSGEEQAWFAQPEVWQEIQQAYATLQKSQQGFLEESDRTNLIRYALLANDTQRAYKEMKLLGFRALYAYDTEPDKGYGRWPNLGTFLQDRARVLTANGKETSFEQQQIWFFAELDKAIERNPKQSWLRRDRAYAHREAGRFENAISDLQAVQQLEPENTEYSYYMGTIAMDKLNDPARALPHFDYLLAAHPKAYSTQRDKAIALVRLDRNDEALALIRKMMTESPDRAEDLVPLVNNYWERQKFQTGIDQLPVIGPLIPREGRNDFITMQTYRSLSVCYETLGQYALARDAMRQATELVPNSYIAHVELARLLILGLDPALRDYPEGIRAGLRALELANEIDYRLLNMIGKAYELNKQPEEALAMYQAVLQVYPDSDNAPARIAAIKAGQLLTE